MAVERITMLIQNLIRTLIFLLLVTGAIAYYSVYHTNLILLFAMFWGGPALALTLVILLPVELNLDKSGDGEMSYLLIPVVSLFLLIILAMIIGWPVGAIFELSPYTLAWAGAWMLSRFLARMIWRIR